MENLLTAVAIGLWGWLWTERLCQADMIFQEAPAFFRRVLNGWKRGPLEGWRLWLYMPIAGCGKCHAGQLSLWLEIWRHFHGGAFDLRLIVVSIAVAALLERK